MGNRVPISGGEWYHCFNRGVDKRRVFESEDDCERFLALLYACNDDESLTRLSDIGFTHLRLAKILKRRSGRGAPLVDIAAYALMPNHVHFIVRPHADASLSKFMQKIFTAYTMYFNKKFDRTGSLFGGTYKSKHIKTDEYFKHALQYVLLNPVELVEPAWKRGKGDLRSLENALKAYPYASVPEFVSKKRPEGAIIYDVRDEYFDRQPSFASMLSDARAYYRENAKFLDC